MSRDVAMYVGDMLEAAGRVVRYSAGLERQAFSADLKTVDAVIRNLEILGEAAKKLPAEVRALEPSIAWRRIAGMRDVLAHAYFGIDEAIVWNVVAVEVPALVPLLQKLRDALDSDGRA